MNARVTKKERALIKGALRRVFSRSELRRRVLNAYAIEHQDTNRPRVSAWVWCAACGVVFPRYLAVVDHIDPLVPLHRVSEDMEPNELVDRLWCEENNLQALDKSCHKIKTRSESKARREFKKRNLK